MSSSPCCLKCGMFQTPTTDGDGNLIKKCYNCGYEEKTTENTVVPSLNKVNNSTINKINPSTKYDNSFPRTLLKTKCIEKDCHNNVMIVYKNSQLSNQYICMKCNTRQ